MKVIGITGGVDCHYCGSKFKITSLTRCDGCGLLFCVAHIVKYGEEDICMYCDGEKAA